MKPLRLLLIIVTVILVVGLQMFVTRANVVPLLTEYDRFNFWVKQCIELKGKDALIACDRAIEINPDDYISWYGRFNALSVLAREEEANWSYAHVLIIQRYNNAISELIEQVDQVQKLIRDEERFRELENAINSGKVSGEQLERLISIRDQLLILRENPDDLEERVSRSLLQIKAGFLEAMKRLEILNPLNLPKPKLPSKRPNPNISP